MKEWQKGIREVIPYTPGEQPRFDKMIKLNTNENPYPPSPKVEEVLRNIDVDKQRLYPDFAGTELIEALSKVYDVPKECIFFGIGSDDVLSMAFLTFFNTGKPILFPDITYSFYDVWAGLYKIPFKALPLDEDFRLVKEDYYSEKNPNGGVVIANPNAPTSIAESADFIEDIIKHNQDSVVIVDEAYVDFGGESVLPLIKKYDNLLVVRTFSKSRSMAGMRIGYAFGNAELIKALNDVKYSFNSYTLNMTAIATGAASALDEEYFEKTCRKIIATREEYKEKLEKLGFYVLDSKTNFLFASPRGAKFDSNRAEETRKLFEALKKENIFVRYFNKPRINEFLRITIGTPEQMETFIKFIENYINV